MLRREALQRLTLLVGGVLSPALNAALQGQVLNTGASITALNPVTVNGVAFAKSFLFTAGTGFSYTTGTTFTNTGSSSFPSRSPLARHPVSLH
jgi:hypothetical protein